MHAHEGIIPGAYEELKGAEGANGVPPVNGGKGNPGTIAFPLVCGKRELFCAARSDSKDPFGGTHFFNNEVCA
jgi:hypothetical protein